MRCPGCGSEVDKVTLRCPNYEECIKAFQIPRRKGKNPTKLLSVVIAAIAFAVILLRMRRK